MMITITIFQGSHNHSHDHAMIHSQSVVIQMRHNSVCGITQYDASKTDQEQEQEQEQV